MTRETTEAVVAYDYDGIFVWGTTFETEQIMKKGELVDEVSELLGSSRKIQKNKQL